MATPPRKRSAAPPPVTLEPPQTVVPESALPDRSLKKATSRSVEATSTAAVPPAQPAAKRGRAAAVTPTVEIATAAAVPKPRKAATKASGKAVGEISVAPRTPRQAKFSVGAVVKHRVYPFRGVVFDVDPVFNNTEDWWQAIPEQIRPRKDQPFYHLLAENAETTYVAYVSEQNLLADKTGRPVRHPQVKEMFALDTKGQYRARFLQSH